MLKLQMVERLKLDVRSPRQQVVAIELLTQLCYDVPKVF